jgi:hypothetical protein
MFATMTLIVHALPCDGDDFLPPAPDTAPPADAATLGAVSPDAFTTVVVSAAATAVGPAPAPLSPPQGLRVLGV